MILNYIIFRKLFITKFDNDSNRNYKFFIEISNVDFITKFKIPYNIFFSTTLFVENNNIKNEINFNNINKSLFTENNHTVAQFTKKDFSNKLKAFKYCNRGIIRFLINISTNHDVFFQMIII